MSLEFWLTKATKQLSLANIATARLDCLVLLEDVLGKDRSWILAHLDHTLSDKQTHSLDTAITRRATHEPLAYIRGTVEFFGRQFGVNTHVLVPRPESETMIELLIQYIPNQDSTIVDIGTGSGALAITAKLELPKTQVIAIDIDPNCITTAKKNAEQHQTDITFLMGNLAAPLSNHRIEQTYVILANLPYVPNDHAINQAALLEPSLAIFGGDDGLDLYRQMFDQMTELRLNADLVITESLPPQHQALKEIAAMHDYSQVVEDDFIQVFRPQKLAVQG